MREREGKSKKKGGFERMSERKDNKNKFNVVTSSFSIHALYKFLVSDADKCGACHNWLQGNTCG